MNTTSASTITCSYCVKWCDYQYECHLKYLESEMHKKAEEARAKQCAERIPGAGERNHVRLRGKGSLGEEQRS